MAIKTIDTSEAARYICREINRFKIVGPSTYQDLLDAAPAVEQEKPINQCDGCQAGMQCIDGLHYHNDKPVMACTKRLYIGKTTPVECEPVGAWKTCATHGTIDTSKAWACPDCLRELRDAYQKCIGVTGEQDSRNSTQRLAAFEEATGYTKQQKIAFMDGWIAARNEYSYLHGFRANPIDVQDAETRRMVLELCDAACEHVKVWEYPYGTRTLELSNKIRERMGRK